MNSADEILDVVDDRDRVVGQAARGEIHARRLNHRAVHVLFFNPQGALFIQQRAPTKDTFPSCYDSSASGHLASGEDYDAAARRELAEELGVDLPPARFEKLFPIAACELTGHEFVRVYRVQGPEQPVPNPAELAGGTFLSQTQVAALIARHPEQCAPSFRLVVALLCDRAG